MSIFKLDNAVNSEESIAYYNPTLFTNIVSPEIPESKTFVRYDRDIVSNSDQIIDGRSDTSIIEDPKVKIILSQGRYNFLTPAGNMLNKSGASSYIFFQNGKFISNSLDISSETSSVEEILNTATDLIANNINISDIIWI